MSRIHPSDASDGHFVDWRVANARQSTYGGRHAAGLAPPMPRLVPAIPSLVPDPWLAGDDPSYRCDAAGRRSPPLLPHGPASRRAEKRLLVTVRNNTFTWTGTGVGEIVKESSRMLVLEGNTVTNAVLKLDPGNNGGGVRVLRNRITFDRSTGGQPAIRLGHNYACWEAYPLGCKVEVRGNHISTGVAQDTAKGILYWAKGPAVDSTVRIVSDTVVGFGRWLKIYGDAATQVAFTVTNNVYAGVTSGAIELGGVVVPTITQSGNMPLPAMTATISGPFRVPAWETRLWVAGSNHGAAPLSYQWYVNNVLQPGATSQEFEYTAGSTDFTVRVVVTDAHLRSASATKPVTVCTDCDA